MDAMTEREKRIALVDEYFVKVDTGDATIFNMFTEDVELYFPKFGTRSGKDSLGVFIQGLLAQVGSLQHCPERRVTIPSGDRVVVEGFESGVAKNGVAWPVEGRSDGRFCNVFRFRGNLISHLHIYVDPDFAGLDTERFYWGLGTAADRQS